MNAELFIDILDKTLLPFIKQVYLEGHKFMQDNDPKHSSNLTNSALMKSDPKSHRIRGFRDRILETIIVL